MSSAELQQGYRVEAHVREVAARLGVAEFVMVPTDVAKGSAKREVSDGLLVCGDRGAILQVKSREAECARADTPEKAVRWARKHIAIALNQGRGTRRALSASTRPVTMLPLRSFDVPPERQNDFARSVPNGTSSWPVIVVVDHPNLPSFQVPADDDVFVVSLDDWVFLHHAIRSTHGLLDYVDRCIEARPGVNVAVGDERSRFDAMCAADGATDDGSPTWAPWLSYAALDDPDAADIYQHFVDRVWPQGRPLPFLEPTDYLPVVEALDRVPPTLRAVTGRRWRRYIEATATAGRASGTVVAPLIAIVVVVEHVLKPVDAERWAYELNAVTRARAQGLGSYLEGRGVLGMGALSQPDSTDYLFAYIPDPAKLPPLPADLVAAIEDEYGPIPSEAIASLAATGTR